MNKTVEQVIAEHIDCPKFKGGYEQMKRDIASGKAVIGISPARNMFTELKEGIDHLREMREGGQ